MFTTPRHVCERQSFAIGVLAREAALSIPRAGILTLLALLLVCLRSLTGCILPEVSQRNQPAEAAVGDTAQSDWTSSANRAGPSTDTPARMSAGKSDGAGVVPTAGEQSSDTAGTAASEQPHTAGTGVAGSNMSGTLQLAPPGAACPPGGAKQCATGICADNVCCPVSFCGICMRCGSSGTCEPLRNTTAPYCEIGSHCDAQANCIVDNGVFCGIDSICQSGICVDKVCCHDRCGPCSRCDEKQSKGMCTPVRGGDDMDSCHGTQTCDSAAACQNIDTDRMERSGAVNFGEIGSRQVAQSFSLSRTANLLEIQILLDCDEGALLTADLRRLSMNGGQEVPSGTVLRPVRDAGVSAQSNIRMLVVEGGLMLGAGERIALVLGTTRGNCAVAQSSSPFPGGSYFSTDAGGGNWEGSSRAFAARTLVR